MDLKKNERSFLIEAMPKVSPEHSKEQRARILAAAFRCFSRKGFHATTMRDICREAEMSAGAVYTYFSGKDQIISALAETGRRSTRDWLEGIGSARPSADALVKVWKDMLTLGHSAGLDSVRLDLRLSAEALDTPEIRDLAARGLANVSAAFARLARAAQSRGRIDPDLDPEAVAQVLVALYNGLSVHALIDPEIDLEAAKRVVEALFEGHFISENSSARTDK